MALFVIEMDGDSRTYGRVHVAGCRDCKDPEPLGDTVAEVISNWP